MSRSSAQHVIDVAKTLRGLGWSVVPVHVPLGNGECSCGNLDCSWPGKHPRVSWKRYTRRLPSNYEVRTWFEDEFYGSNVGVVTGAVSRLAVVDVDGDPAEFDKLGLPDTLTAHTGGGGRHHFYRLRPGVKAPSGISVVPGIDIKAEGGFVVVPPSRHVSGNRYSWGHKQWPAELTPDDLPKRSVASPSANGDYATWFNELLSGVPESMRSNSAAKLAGRYAQLGLSAEESCMLMHTWNEMNDPPMSPRELGATIRAVYRRHEDNAEQNVDTLEDLHGLLTDMLERERG